APDEPEMPGTGGRREPDDLLNSAAMFEQAGTRDPLGTDDFTGVQKMLRTMPVGQVAASSDGLTIDLDDPPDHPAKLITVRNQHPNLGHGVLQLLQLPPLENTSRAAEFAAQLNREEAARSLRTQWLGGWCVDAEGRGLTFASFIPALAL